MSAKSAMPTKGKTKGFSLVELIVAVTISSILMLGMSTFFSSTFNQLFKAQQNSELMQRQFAVNEIIRSKLLHLKKVDIGKGWAFILNHVNNGQLPFTYMAEKNKKLVFKDFLFFNKMGINPKNNGQHLFADSGNGSIRYFRNGGAGSPDKLKMTTVGDKNFNNLTSFASLGNHYFFSFSTENKVLMCECGSQGDCRADQCKNLPNSPLLNHPTDLAVHGKNLYIADSGNGRIIRYQPTTRSHEVIASQLKFPTGLAHYVNGADELLFFSETLANQVKKIDLNTGKISLYSGGGNDQNCTLSSAEFCQLNMPTGLFIPKGKNELYVADSGNNRILKITDPKKPDEIEFSFETKDQYQLDRILITNDYWGNTAELDMSFSNLIGEKKHFDKKKKVFQNPETFSTYDDQSSNCRTTSNYFHVNENPQNLKIKDFLKVGQEILQVSNLPQVQIACDPKGTINKWRIIANVNDPQKLSNHQIVHLSHPKQVKLKLKKLNLKTTPNGFHTFKIEIYDKVSGLVETHYKSIRSGDSHLGSKEDIIEVLANSITHPNIDFPTGLTDLYFANSGEKKIRSIQQPNLANQLNTIDPNLFESYDYESYFKIDSIEFKKRNKLFEVKVVTLDLEGKTKPYLINGFLPTP